MSGHRLLHLRPFFKIMNFKRSIALPAMVLAAATAIAATSANAADIDSILEKARAEASQGKFVNMVSSPKGEQAQRALMEAFQKRFDLEFDWEWLPLTSAVSAPRVIEQAKANVALPSVIGGYPYERYDAWFVENDLVASVDWVDEFEDIFPDIKKAAVDGVLPGYRNKLMRQWDVLYVMVYNTDQVEAKDAPRRLSDLADPKWRGRFAISNNTPPPLDILALHMGKEGVVDLTRDLLANEPRFKAGPPAVVGAIASGEVPVGVAGYTALAESLKKKGAPLAWVPLEQLPIGPLFVFMLKDSPHPNLGKLFLAWLVTEGQEIQEQQENLSFFANEESPTTKAILAAEPDIKTVQVQSAADQVLIDEAGREIMGLISGVAGKK